MSQPPEVIQVDLPGHQTDPSPPASSPWLGRERLAGLSLIGFGLFALYASADLPFRGEGDVGSGMLPRALSIILILLGAVQIVMTWNGRPESTGRWPMRDMLPVLIGIFLFAITIRGHEFGAFDIPPLGLAVSTPLAVFLSGLAAKDVRIGELAIFTVVLTVVCIGLFRYALGLSLPVAPWLIGY